MSIQNKWTQIRRIVYVKLQSIYVIIPSNNDTMLRANATVMHLGRIETVKVGSKPTRRPASAVEYSENSVDRMTDVKISAACLFTS